MELLDLFDYRLFGEELCEKLTFEDAIRIQHALGKDRKFPCTIQVTDAKGLILTFKEITPETIQIYRLIKGKDAAGIFLGAVRSNRLDIIQGLLNVGIDINLINEQGYTALFLAIVYDHEEIIRFLLKNKANLNIINHYQEDALIKAALSSSPEIVQLLIDYGANVNTRGENGVTALNFASIYNRASIVEILLRNGADVNGVDEQGNTSLHFSSQYGNQKSAQLLLNNGANVNAVNYHGQTPLMLAQSPEIIKLLREYGAQEQ